MTKKKLIDKLHELQMKDTEEHDLIGHSSYKAFLHGKIVAYSIVVDLIISLKED